MRRLLARHRHRQAMGDEGFTLVEAMVSCAIMLIFALAISTVLTSELGASRVDRQRVSAANLAEREQEIVRNRFENPDTSNALAIASQTYVLNPDPLSGPVGTPSVVDGTSYNIERDTAWLPTGNGQSACDGGSLVTFPSLRVHVEVTWPNMGSVPPVVSDTIMTPPKTINTSNDGYIAVRVTDRNGANNVSRNVTASGPGGTQTVATDTSGCAVFQFATAGTYTISLGEPGFVDYYANPTPSKQQTLTLGTLQRLSMTYDRAATLTTTFTTAAGYSLPSTLPMVTISNSGLQTNALHTESLASGGLGITSIPGLWPFSSGYTVWAGGCADADPAAAPTNGTRTVAAVSNPGQTTAVTVPLAPMVVQVEHIDGTPLGAGIQVVANNQLTTPTPCATADKTLTLGTTDANGQLHTSLPYGSWALTASGVTGPTFNLAQTGPVPTEYVQVS